ncbi:hypothetical protein [Halomarina rubra]|uniref:Uncharacterized protein n=1 Tax=Halomarina rubra TaxID=2071873 RepID=A0ABD6AYF7_9EURY|nr:hypothetical protein [Halomarina rubra]
MDRVEYAIQTLIALPTVLFAVLCWFHRSESVTEAGQSEHPQTVD